MKCISLWNPWATLMALGVKTIETRSWGTDFRGQRERRRRREDLSLPTQPPCLLAVPRPTVLELVGGVRGGDGRGM